MANIDLGVNRVVDGENEDDIDDVPLLRKGRTKTGKISRLKGCDGVNWGDVQSVDDPVVEEEELKKTYFTGGWSTISTKKSLARLKTLHGVPASVHLEVPEPDDRPWNPPEGFLCMYECYFSSCGLWFPLPELFVDYCREREIAVSQLCPAPIRNMVVSFTLGVESGVVVNYEFFEEVTIKKTNPDTPGKLYASFKPGMRLLSGQSPSKIRDWERQYFFVKINSASVLDVNRSYRRDWNLEPARHPRRTESEDLNFFVRSIQQKRNRLWEDFSEERIKQALSKYQNPSSEMVRLAFSLGSYSKNFKKASTSAPRAKVGAKVGVDRSQTKISAWTTVGETIESDDVVVEIEEHDDDVLEKCIEVVYEEEPVEPTAKRNAEVTKTTGNVTKDAGSKKRRMEPPRDSELGEGEDSLGGSPHGIVFRYAGEYNRFPCDKKACADLAQKIAFGDAPRPNFDGSAESNSFQCASQALVTAMAHISYVECDAKAAARAMEVQAEKRLTDLQKALEAERVKTAGYDKLRKEMEEEKRKRLESAAEVTELKAKVVALTAELEKTKTSSSLLRDERDSSREEASIFRENIKRAKKVAADEKTRVDRRVKDFKMKCVAKFQKIQRYLEGMKNAQPIMLELSQVVGTQECLQVLVDEDGVKVPAYRLKQLEKDEAAYRADLDKIDVPELSPDDFVLPSSVVSVVGPGVAPPSSRLPSSTDTSDVVPPSSSASVLTPAADEA